MNDAFPELYRDLTAVLDRERKAATVAYIKGRYGRTGAVLARRKDVAGAVVEVCCGHCEMITELDREAEGQEPMWVTMRDEIHAYNRAMGSAYGTVRKYFPDGHPLVVEFEKVRRLDWDKNWRLFDERPKGTSHPPTGLIYELGDLLRIAGIKTRKSIAHHIYVLLNHHNLQRQIRPKSRTFFQRTGADPTELDTPKPVSERAIEQMLARPRKQPARSS